MSILTLSCVIQPGINGYASMVSDFVMLICVQISVDVSLFQSDTKSMQLSTVNQHLQSTLNQH